MYIDVVPNRNSPPTVLLRTGTRRGRKVEKRTVANLTDWPAHQIAAFRKLLRGEVLVSAQDAFSTERTIPHGHVEAILGTIRKTGVEQMLGSRRSRERDIVEALVVERLVHPCSKLATTRLWGATTVGEELGVEEADEDEVYAAMDWLEGRQRRIEGKLARKHLGEGAQVLYDVTSSYYEGETCALARLGHDRDKKRWKLIVVYGVLMDREGRPIAVEVYPGNTGDSTTVVGQVEKLRERFGLGRVVLVGDRGTLTETQLTTLRRYPGMGWITAMRSEEIRKLVKGETIQLSVFDEENLAEVKTEAYPGERLIACYNPMLAEERRKKREELLGATERELARVEREVGRRKRKKLSEGEIGRKVGAVVNRYKVGKHFAVKIEAGAMRYERKRDSIEREAALDGIYVIRTSEPVERLSTGDAVRSYKNLAQVERLFRTLKGIDLLVRPIRHRLPPRVRAHIFLCMLAYYVEWHMRNALAPLLFDDEGLGEERWRRDPVAPAEATEEAKRKKSRRTTEDGLPIHSFETLLAELGTRTRNLCRVKAVPDAPAFTTYAEPTPVQRRALELLGLFPGS